MSPVLFLLVYLYECLIPINACLVYMANFVIMISSAFSASAAADITDFYITFLLLLIWIHQLVFIIINERRVLLVV